MDALKRTLEEDRKQANDKFALGPDLYAQMVSATREQRVFIIGGAVF